jgi:hypothetical protein
MKTIRFEDGGWSFVSVENVLLGGLTVKNSFDTVSHYFLALFDIFSLSCGHYPVFRPAASTS